MKRQQRKLSLFLYAAFNFGNRTKSRADLACITSTLVYFTPPLVSRFVYSRSRKTPRSPRLQAAGADLSRVGLVLLYHDG